MTGSGWILLKRRGRLFFVNKKKQKNFFPLRRAGFVATGPNEPKVFCAAFFQKSGFLPVST
jgi:hypothetical protein